MSDYLKTHPQPCQCPFCECERRWIKRLSELAERSGVPQGCLPSANCSAGAGADAPSDSMNSSVVPRETAVLERLTRVIIKWQLEARERRADAAREIQLGSEHEDVNIAYAECLEDRCEELNRLVAEFQNAHQCNGERALARNAKLTDAGPVTPDLS